MEYTLKNGWTIKEQKNGTGLLHIIPAPKSLFRYEEYVVIPQNVFEEIKNGERNIFSLLTKYKLYNIIPLRGEKVIPNPKPNINTENCYQGTGFFVTHEDDKYFFRYLLSRHGGGERKFEISKEIYEDARKGEMSVSDILKKYNLYHLDIPENDVK
jgi:hypothetical protein